MGSFQLASKDPPYASSVVAGWAHFAPTLEKRRPLSTTRKSRQTFSFDAPQSELRVSASQGRQVLDQINNRLRQVRVSRWYVTLKRTLGLPAKLSLSTKLFLTQTAHLAVASPSYPKIHCLEVRRLHQRSMHQ